MITKHYRQKVKIIAECRLDTFEEKLNLFLSDLDPKDIINIQYQQDPMNYIAFVNYLDLVETNYNPMGFNDKNNNESSD